MCVVKINSVRGFYWESQPKLTASFASSWSGSVPLTADSAKYQRRKWRFNQSQPIKMQLFSHLNGRDHQKYLIRFGWWLWRRCGYPALMRWMGFSPGLNQLISHPHCFSQFLIQFAKSVGRKCQGRLQPHPCCGLSWFPPDKTLVLFLSFLN